MSWLSRAWRTVTSWTRRPTDADLDKELRLHLELETEHHRAAGMGAGEAARQARVRLGNRPLIAEDMRAAWRWAWLDDLRLDLRLAARLLAKHWRFSALAVLVLALATGANTALFSVANAVLLKPLPVHQPGQLVWIYGNDGSNIPYDVYRDYRDAMTTVTGLAGFELMATSVRFGEGARVLSGTAVTGNYFEVLGIQPWLGRLVASSDVTETDAREVVVLGHDLWQGRFDADPGVVGRGIRLNGRTFEVVGVAPPGFRGVLTPVGVDLWIPVKTAGDGEDSLHVIARRAADATGAAVAAEVATLRDRFSAADPDRHFFPTMTTYPTTGRSPVFGMIAPFVFPLLGLVTLALLVACFNLASLLLARSTARGQEMGVRLALGAGQGRLVRQLVTESLLLTLVGAGAGLVLARWAAALLLAIDLPIPGLSAVPLMVDVRFDWRVFAFATTTAALAVLTFGLVPAWQTTRAASHPTVRRQAVPLTGRRLSRTRALLITAQLALSVVLLTAAGLLLQSWRNAADADLGFDPAPVLAVGVTPGAAGYDEARRRSFYQALATGLPGLPGVTASAVEIVPLTLTSRADLLLGPGEEIPPPAARAARPARAARTNRVSPGYFRTVGIPLLAGRDFTLADGPGAPAVMVVDQTLADRFWPGESPLGRRLRRLQGPRPPFSYTEVTVVGVVANATYARVGEATTPFAYFPLLQSSPRQVTVLATRGAGDPLALLPLVRGLLDRVDPNVPTSAENRLGSLTGLSVLPVSAAGVLVGVLGLLTLALAAIGITGVLLYLVRQRTPEIGVRIALGATTAAVTRLVVGHSLRWVTTGLVIGTVASLALSRLVSSFLYDVSPTEPAAFAGAVLLLAVVGVLASLAPARRACRTDPMTALRAE